MESKPTLLSLVRSPLLVEACYPHYRPPYPEGVASSGAVTVNRDWEEGKSKEWFIDWQRWGGQLVQVGIVLQDDRMIRQGWKILHCGFARQGPDGDFPGSSGAPLNTTSFFVEAAARALVLQQQSGDKTYAKDIADYAPKLHAAARWMIRADVAAQGQQANRPFTHRYWVMAAALGQAAAVTDDRTVGQAAEEYARNGIALQTPEGINPEFEGYDVRYQVIGALFAARYYAVCRDPELQTLVKTMLLRALRWEMTRMDAPGVVDTAGSTRVGREKDREGVTKTIDYLQLVEAFVYGSAITGDPRFKHIATRVAVHQGWIKRGFLRALKAWACRPAPCGGDALIMSGREPSYSFVFICQAGELEVKALLLAASLKRFLRGPYELIAAIPTPEAIWGAPSEVTLQLLGAMQVRTVSISNEVDPAFTHGNKIDCLNVKVSTDWLVLMDSDILCLKDFRDEVDLTGPFSAKPVDHQTFTKDICDWETAYATAGVLPPRLQIPSTVSKEYGLPYFNSGFLVVEPGGGLGPAWLDCCLKIRANESIPEMRMISDQAGLAVAVQKLRLPFYCLDERFNYPTHLKPLMEHYAPFFAHYHWPEVIFREPALRKNVRLSVKQFPAIARVMEAHPQWASLLDKKPRPRRIFPRPKGSKPKAAPDLIITGISRSGSSYLCNLLHRYSNCVVLNEPAQIFAPLINESIPWSIPVFYKQVRANILSGRPIVNKLSNGEITEDTAIHEQEQTYVPIVDGEDFVLGVKNNMAYISNLNRLRRVMPEARMVVCVRNPFDTIASWKSSFEHLRKADIRSRPVGHPDDPVWPVHHSVALNRIAGVDDLAQRRAMLWQFLAELVLDQLGHIVLVNYATLVTRPHAVLDTILKDYRRGTLRKPIYASEVRSKRAKLEREDDCAIQTICSQSAAELGLLD